MIIRAETALPSNQTGSKPQRYCLDWNVRPKSLKWIWKEWHHGWSQSLEFHRRGTSKRARLRLYTGEDTVLAAMAHRCPTRRTSDLHGEEEMPSRPSLLDTILKLGSNTSTSSSKGGSSLGFLGRCCTVATQLSMELKTGDYGLRLASIITVHRLAGPQ
jgi:hypothetical protein